MRVRIAAAIVSQTLVDVSTLDPVADEAFMAGALVGTLSVLALGELAAGVRVQETLVVVRAASTSFRFHGVSFVAAAIEGSDGVVALAVAADLRLRHTLVDV